MYEKSNVECYKHHKYGHYSWECRTNAKDKVIFVDDGEVFERTLLLALKNDEKDDKGLWYLAPSW